MPQRGLKTLLHVMDKGNRITEVRSHLRAIAGRISQALRPQGRLTRF